MNTRSDLIGRYEAAASLWPDKMRVLGYRDAYLGMVSHWPRTEGPGRRMIDVGSGSGAMAEAWVAVHGAPEDLVLLDPSAGMLERGREALMRRGVVAECVVAGLAPGVTDPADTVLAAHVIEHFDDAAAALGDIASLTRPGGELWLVVSKPHWCNAIIWLQWRHRTYGTDAVARLLDDAGFDLRRTYAFPSGPPSRTSRGFVAMRRAH